MRTVGPVDRGYVLFNKNIIIFSEWHNFFLKHSLCGKTPLPPPGGVKHPQGAMGNYCSYSVVCLLNILYANTLF